MHIVCPEATYGDTPVFQLVLNFKEWARLIAFVLFIPPYVWTVRTAFRRRTQVAAQELAFVLGSAVFMGMWWFLGRVEEVRLFLPFPLPLAPLARQLPTPQRFADDP